MSKRELILDVIRFLNDCFAQKRIKNDTKTCKDKEINLNKKSNV